MNRKGPFGTLRLSPADAQMLGCSSGDTLRLSTRRGSVEVVDLAHRDFLAGTPWHKRVPARLERIGAA